MAIFRLVVRDGNDFSEDKDYESETLPRAGEHLLSRLEDEDRLTKVVSVVHPSDTETKLILVVGDLVASGKKLDILEIAKKAVGAT